MNPVAVFHFHLAQIMQRWPPTSVLLEIFSDSLRQQDMTGVAIIHHALGEINPDPGRVDPRATQLIAACEPVSCEQIFAQGAPIAGAPQAQKKAGPVKSADSKSTGARARRRSTTRCARASSSTQRSYS